MTARTVDLFNAGMFPLLSCRFLWKYYHYANIIVTKLVRIYIFEMIERSERCFLLLRALQTLIYEDIASAIELVFNYLDSFGGGLGF